MTQLKTVALGLAMLAASASLALQANAMPDSKMSSSDMMASCKAMPRDQMTADTKCMKMMHMSSKDMKTMKSCQAMDHDMMMKNKGCMKMMKMHPGMMDDSGMMKK
jgi:hypothetical protein